MRLVRLVMIGCLVFSAQAGAQTLYGTTHQGSSPSEFVQLDPATGALIATIGSVGYAVNGMAWDATTNTLYATTSTNDPSFPDGLITIDPATGAGTPVGSGAGQFVNVPTCNSAGVLYGWTEATDDPVLWDKAAGTITVIGDSGLDTMQQGLAFDSSDVLHLVNGGDTVNGNATIYTIDTTTAQPTLVGTVGPLPYGLAHHGKFNPADGYYYGIDRNPYYDTTGYNIVVIDVASLSIVRTLPTVDRLHTLVFVGGAALPIPDLSGTGMALMVLLLAGATILVVRRFS